MHMDPLLPSALLAWYEKRHRDLPWRHTRDPYPIWLSEIMLQQTRVEAVKGYYARFLEALPDIASLARCDDERLHKLWEGLGYYSRVRNLKKAAIRIMECHNGVFPSRYEEVLALPGIGEYTAGAICSIAYNMPTPAVDGNVLRVVTRLTGDFTPIDRPAFKTEVREALEEIYPARAGDFTQALMELGATLCGPNRKPECRLCPCASFCTAASQGIQEKLPVKEAKRPRRQEEMTVFVLRRDGSYALEKRPSEGLLANLWQFPNTPGHLQPQEAVDLVSRWGLKPRQLLKQTSKAHIFTHIQWNMRCYYMEVEEAGATFHWFTPAQLNQKAALPTAFRQFWEDTDA